MWRKQDSAESDETALDQPSSETNSAADNSENELAVSAKPGDKAAQQIAALEHAQRVLAEVSSFEGIKEIRDKAEAVRRYAASAKLGLALQNKAAELKLRAERRAGELLARLNLAGGDHRTSSRTDQLSLADLEINKHQSSRWQREAAVPDEAFEQLLRETSKAERELTTAALLRMAKAFRDQRSDNGTPRSSESDSELALTSIDALVGQCDRFSCIYAAPPLGVGANENGTPPAPDAVARELEEICQLPVENCAADNAHLHLWMKHEWLWSAPRIMEAWGFSSVSGLVWVQPQSGGGAYWRRAHEYLLLGVRGELSFRTRGPLSWVRANRLRRGRKPERFRRLIERVSPGPYLELFGTKPVKGWTVCGDERMQ